jgi:hypothetical protein
VRWAAPTDRLAHFVWAGGVLWRGAGRAPGDVRTLRVRWAGATARTPRATTKGKDSDEHHHKSQTPTANHQ